VKRFVFSGTPRELGEQFGESCRLEIADLYRLRVENALSQAKEYGKKDVDEAVLLELSKKCLPVSERYDPEGYEELAGIARGASLQVEQVFAMNGLTDLRDVLAFGDMDGEGCSSFVIQRELTRDRRVLLGQTWDLATDNMPFVVAVERRPKGRAKTWSMTTVGCLSLIGLNEDGVAIGTTNLRTTDSKVGVCYLQMIHRALRTKLVGEARDVIVGAPRAGAHYYYAADGQGGAAAIECTATTAQVTAIDSGYFVHCNHVLDSEQKRIEAATPMASSLCRQARMGTLIATASAKAPITVEAAMKLLADHDAGNNAICRHDYNGISSNGSMIMEPETRKSWVVHGPACRGVWEQLS
jgi:isopenicillin-N N-acyltransferase-like protein